MTDYEKEARARKVALLVETIDTALVNTGYDPKANAIEVIPVLQTTSILNDCVKLLGKKTLSPETRAGVIAVYQERAGIKSAAAPEPVAPAPSAPLSRITASKIDLAIQCLHWATLELPPDVSGERAVRGTAFHDLVATGEIQPNTLRDLKPEYEVEVRKMYAVWLKNGAKLLPPNPRHEVAFVLQPDGTVRELGQNIARAYGGAVGLCGSIDVYGDDVARDFKTGRKYHDASEAWQLRFAAVVTGCHKTAFDYIAASGRTTPDEYTRSDEQIEADRKRLMVLMTDLTEGRTDPNPGSHCADGYCPARAQCAAFQRAFSAPAKDSRKTQGPTQETIMGKMALTNIKNGRIETPICAVLYGPEGIGKSTFAANAPAPVFLGAEDGTGHLDVSRFPVPANWDEAREALAELAGPHDFRSIVIDTADWLEPLIHDHVCREGSKASIEDFGYGKGYIAALELWRSFLGALDSLRMKRGMNVIVLAHSQVKTFRNPAGDDYDRYELKLNAKAAGLIKEWANAVLFTNYITHAKLGKDDKSGKVKALGDGSRVVYTEHRPAWDAKNRYGLPFKLPLDWAEFERATRIGEPASFEELAAEITQLAESVDAKTKEQVAPAIERCGKDTRKLAALADWLRSKANKEAA